MSNPFKRTKARSIFTHSVNKSVFFELSQNTTQIICPFAIDGYNTIPNAPVNSSLADLTRTVGSVFTISGFQLENNYNIREYKHGTVYSQGDVVFWAYRYFTSTIDNNTNPPLNSSTQLPNTGWQDSVVGWSKTTEYMRGQYILNMPDPNDADRNAHKYNYHYYVAIFDRNASNINVGRYVDASYPIYDNQGHQVYTPDGHEMISPFWESRDYVPNIPIDIGIIEYVEGSGYSSPVYYNVSNIPVPARNTLYYENKLQLSPTQALVVTVGTFNNPRIDNDRTGKILGTLNYTEFYE